jgi:hypothetical protein
MCKGNKKCTKCKKKKKMARRPVGALRKQKKKRIATGAARMVAGPLSGGSIPLGPAGIVTDFLDTKSVSRLRRTRKKKR